MLELVLWAVGIISAFIITLIFVYYLVRAASIAYFRTKAEHEQKQLDGQKLAKNKERTTYGV